MTTAAGYVHLAAVSCFSFRRGASAPEALVEAAVGHGYDALALADWHGPYGAPRFAAAARAAGLRAILGATVRVQPGGRLVLLVRDAGGWANLCRLLSAANLAGTKEQPRLTLATLALYAGGLTALVGPDSLVAARLAAGDEPGAAAALAELQALFPNPGGAGDARLWLELVDHLTPDDAVRNRRLVALGESAGVGAVATNMVQYAAPEDAPLHDVFTCLRLRTTLPAAGIRLAPNREAWLKPRELMAARFAWHPPALANAARIAARCTFELTTLDGRLPPFPVPAGESAFSYLHRLATDGARERYRPLTPAAAQQLAHELALIERLGFSTYFLVVWDLCRFARERGILCQGRGSAANSVVAYALGITNVDPIGLGLLFERFLSEDRAELPDIDIDFAHERREEVIQYVYERYGRDRAGMVAELICYRERLAARELGRALGVPPARLKAFAADLAAGTADAEGVEGAEAGDDAEDETGGEPADDRRRPGPIAAPRPLRLLPPAAAAPPARPRPLPEHLRDLCGRMAELPRHLGIHSGGMVLTARPLVDLVPLERATMGNRTVVIWDKDDIAALGMVKLDLLGLGMLTLLGTCLRLIKATRGVELDLARLQPDDPSVYEMLGRADTIGVFQVESRAQMGLAPRLQPRTFYDLVVSVALIRPGPIQGGSVHPYLRRRRGDEAVTYPHPLAEPILARTLGVPLFQEQGMRLAMAVAGFTAGEADQLRRAMGKGRSSAAMRRLEERFFAGAAARGVERAAAEEIWGKLAAFASYGFAESHAASFALLVYQSAYLKRYYPLEYACSLLSAQPLGFWPVGAIIGDVRRRGFAVLPPDVLRSRYDWTLEALPGGARALRTGLRVVKGIGAEHAARLDEALAAGPYRDLDDFRRRTGLEGVALANLAACGAFAGLGLDRRTALWAAGAERAPAGLLPGLAVPEESAELPPMSVADELAEDYRVLGFSARHGHVLGLYRAQLRARRVRTAAELADLPSGATAQVAGLVTIVQQPPTANGMCFVTLEDESGLADLVLRPPVARRSRALLAECPLVLAAGRVQRAHGVTNLQVTALKPLGMRVGAAGLTPATARRLYR